MKAKFISYTSLFALCMVLFSGVLLRAQDNTQVLTMKIDQEIDPRMNRYTELALARADEIEADLIIIEMDTYGGALNDADDIRTRILNYEKPILVWINKDAASAGALISIACDSIYMAKGASIGAATVVTADGAAAPDKYQSYMRSIMRSTAEAQGRDPKIAEAMVDENLEVDTISSAGTVITFSTNEAITYGFCEAQVDNIEEILERQNISSYDIEAFELSDTEKIISVFLNPFISGILILIIIGGIYFELQTPGLGFPIVASVIAVILYFVPYYLNGLAENWEIIIFFVGIVLLAAEIFFIPGFGVAGIAGLICTLGALVLVMLNNDTFDFSFVEADDLFVAISTTMAGLLGAIVVMIIGGVRLTNSEFFKRIALQDVQDRNQGYTSNFKTETFVGKLGKTYTVLRPSGKIIIEDDIYDAYTRGNYIDKDVDVEVVAEDGTSLKVKEAK